MLFEKCLHFFLEIQPILRVLEAMAFVYFQIVDALKANGKRREIDRVDVGMKRIGAEKMEVFIALPVLLEQHVATVGRPDEMHDPALRVMSDRLGRVQTFRDIADPDVHAASLRRQKGELPPVGRNRHAANLRIIEKILERNARSRLSARTLLRLLRPKGEKFRVQAASFSL